MFPNLVQCIGILRISSIYNIEKRSSPEIFRVFRNILRDNYTCRKENNLVRGFVGLAQNLKVTQFILALILTV